MALDAGANLPSKLLDERTRSEKRNALAFVNQISTRQIQVHRFRATRTAGNKA